MDSYKKYFMDEDISIYRQTGFEMENHLHDFIELVYVVCGKGVHKIDEIEHPVKKGNLIIINYNQLHSFKCDETYEHYNVLIKPEFIDDKIKNREDVFSLLDILGYEDFKNLIDKGNCVISFSQEERSRFEMLLSLLETEFKNKNSGYQVALHSYISLLFTMIFRKMSQPVFLTDGVVNAHMLEYINNHYNENITAEFFAKIGHYNISYFSRMFKKYTGETFTEYLKKVRIKKACKLIESTDYKISEIYTQVGYSDKTKFFKHFREFTKTTPLKYRKGQN